MKTIFEKQPLGYLLILFLAVISCNKNNKETPPDYTKSKIETTKGNFHIEFLNRITDEEVENGQNGFKELELNAEPGITLDYYDFEKIVNIDKKKYAKFFFLLDNNKFLNLGLAMSDNENLDYENDILYVQSGGRFVLKSGEFENQKKEFDAFKSVLVDTVSKNDPCDMILYKVDDINNYLKVTKAIEGFTGYKILSLQFDYIRFKDFTRKDGTKIDYLRNRESRVSFAVKTNFDKGTTRASLPNDIVDFYYDAGDLKP
ncbi:hypothetical protein [Chryseobacterium oryctis]|uniref:Lipoprotein n=1 Tax=Chryseobacterium oryctis TaxID=2952618 RepID=A0ABT3HR10_9FLAO|nr:hypothetical protein [Chryseobacterium oryctis]MCW3162058.1 hypothetical protein [Chryseobacterium oryctis]